MTRPPERLPHHPTHRLPAWARAVPAVVERCARDLDYRLRVLAAVPRERARLVAEAERAARGAP